MGGWMDVKAVLRIVYSNKKCEKPFIHFFEMNQILADIFGSALTDLLDLNLKMT
jgi:hypothetical protein